MNFFDKNGVLLKNGVIILNKNGDKREILLALDGETLGLKPLNIKDWTIEMGVEPLSSLNLNEWEVDLSAYNNKYYHVTLEKNVNSILSEGLIPFIGERSEEIGEKEPLVYLFPSIEDMEFAVMQWLGDWYEEEYGEDVKLIGLKIELPFDFPIENGEVDYECISRDTIPSKYISFLKELS